MFILKHLITLWPLIYFVQSAQFYDPPIKRPKLLLLKILKRDNNIIVKALDPDITKQLVRKLYQNNQETSDEILDNFVDNTLKSTLQIKDIRAIKDALDKRNYLSSRLFQPREFQGKKVLVKRLVPHNDEAKRLEYDHAYNAYFKPLFRVHKKKQYQNHDENERNQLLRKLKKTIDYIKQTDELMLEPFEITRKGYKKRNSRLRSRSGSLTKEILDFMERVNHDLKNYNEPQQNMDSIKKMLSGVDITEIELRKGKSTEDYLPDNMKIHGVEADKPKESNEIDKHPPFHNMFTYWTYHKPIHLDACPKDQVKIGNVCAWLPPHRRLLYEYLRK